MAVQPLEVINKRNLGMVGISFNKFTPICFLSLLLSIPVASAFDDLPEILDYYPNCSYQIIDNAVVRVKTEQPFAKETTLALLNKLRKKAKSIGADALILTNKDADKVMNTEKYYGASSADVAKYEVSYEAELINQCEAGDKLSKESTPYNHLGNKSNKTVIGKTTITTKFVFTPPKKAQLNHPVVNSTELSLANGIYGIKIGTEYKQVIERLGDPSVVLREFGDELILGYGRKLWLHFHSNKLVKVQSQLDSLSVTLLNKIPLRDFFDDNPWVIANKVVRQSSLAEVKSALAIESELNEKSQLVFKNEYSRLILNFSYRKSDDGNEKLYFLDGFSLQKNSYSKPSYQVSDSRKLQFEALELALSKLKQDQDIAWQSLSVKLGQPIGRITLSAASSIDVYNANLLIKTRGGELVNIQLLEPLFTVNEISTKDSPWFLGEYIQGKSMEQLRALFPIDSFELDNRVEIDTELYQLQLFFDESENDTSLYEAEISFY